MTFLAPLWLQGGTYPARFDRQLIKRAFGLREMVFDGLVGSQSTTPAVTVKITLGSCVITGDDAPPDQGSYLIVQDADTAAFAMPAVPGSNKRIDLVSIQVNDPQAGGAAGNNAVFVCTQGSVSATPVAPSPPLTAIPLFTVLRTAGDAAITNAMITDVAARGLWPYTVSTAAPPANLPPNYLWVRVS